MSSIPKARGGQSVLTQFIDDYDEGVLSKRGQCIQRKFAPVCPIRFYREFQMEKFRVGSVLLLAHDVVKQPEAYNEVFKHSFWDGVTIFMDNSLVELKKAVDIKMVGDAVDAIGRPQVVVICPDVMAESQASAKLTKDAWPEWSWRFRDHQKLVVIQGNKIDNFLECAEELEELGTSVEWVSIPRVTENLFGYHRRELVPYISSIFPWAKIHLLGFSDYIWEDLRAAADHRVMSIDSAVPFRMGTDRIFSEPIPPRDKVWFEKGTFDRSVFERISEIERLIHALI